MKIIETILANVGSARKNSHVAVPGLLAAGCKIAAIWLPHYAAQFGATAAVLLTYMGLAAARSAPGDAQGSGKG